MDWVVKMFLENTAPGVKPGSVIEAEFEIEAPTAEAAVTCARDMGKGGFVYLVEAADPKEARRAVAKP